MQDWDGRPVPEIGYHLRRDRWHRGYASEAAAACRDHAFHVLGFREVYSNDLRIPQNCAPGVEIRRRDLPQDQPLRL